MRLGTRVAGGLALLLLLMTAFGAYQLLLTERLVEANRQISADLEISRSALRLRRVFDRLSALTRRFLVLRDEAYLSQLQAERKLGAAELSSLQALTPGALSSSALSSGALSSGALTPRVDELPALRALDASWQGYLSETAELETEVVEGKAEAAAGTTLLESLEELNAIVTRLDLEAVEQAYLRIGESTAQAAEAQRLAIAVGIAGFVLAAGLAIWVGRSTTVALGELTAGARAMSEGDFAHRVTPRGPAEVTSLARDFNDMATRLGELDQLKRDFLANVSHDLKAPLASIQEATRLLLDQSGEQLTGEQRRLLELNGQSARRLESMIADLLDVARLDAGSIDFDLEPVDLGLCCDQVLEQAASLLAAKKVDVARLHFDGGAMVDVDPPMILRALSNVVTNAINFSPEGGRLSLEISRVETGRGTLAAAAPDQALLTVEDQGPGVPDSDKTRIFDRFYRAREHSPSASGTGLGLAIARAIIEGHRGRIWVTDASAGGSVFNLQLPLTARNDRPEGS